MQKWNNINSIAEYRTTMLDFLNGKINVSNNHYGKLDIESELIKDKLIRINRLGFITTGSQPGYLDKYYRQREYIDGLIEKKIFNNFLEKLNNNGIKYITTENCMKCFDNVTINTDYALRYVNKKKKIYNVDNDTIYYVDTHTPVVDKPEYLFDDHTVNLNNNMKRLLMDSYECIFVYVNEYGNTGGLCNQVIDILSTIK
jgi:hypothetical protein